MHVQEQVGNACPGAGGQCMSKGKWSDIKREKETKVLVLRV